MMDYVEKLPESCRNSFASLGLWIVKVMARVVARMAHVENGCHIGSRFTPTISSWAK